jgi:hypothetical protein
MSGHRRKKTALFFRRGKKKIKSRENDLFLLFFGVQRKNFPFFFKKKKAL